jgi:hypothetical protein
VQLRRIAQCLGIPDPEPVQTSKPQTLDEILRDAAAAGFPIAEGRPDDPMLDLLDL